MKTQEKVALSVSAVIVVTTVVYWIMQIAGAYEMLKLAYGE